ncbi:MAG: peptide chain release factor 2 [Tissierellia bacterium]|nr:peptide chain release factor 2 [Tissierellia bacterium]
MMQNTYLEKQRLEKALETLSDLGRSLDIDMLRSEVVELENKTLANGFWDDVSAAQKLFSILSGKKAMLSEYDDLAEAIEEQSTMLEIIEELDEDSEYKAVVKSIGRIEKKVEEFRLITLFDGEYDRSDTILSIHAGAGGTEAQDWAGMLLRMYTRWAEDHGFKIQTLDIIPEAEGGVKSVTLSIEGNYAYGWLKAEKGVHRLVRISPFDTAKKRHTSFASVDIYPQLDDDATIDLRAEDLKIDTYRSSGAGGQHVNTTDSAVRITHLPTGVVVQCQNERSQTYNREKAMKMLMAKLLAIAEEEKKEKIDDLQGNYSQIAWGSQIRSYVFHPYTMVKDHRTGEEVGDVSKVMDGDIDDFINAYLIGQTKE